MFQAPISEFQLAERRPVNEIRKNNIRNILVSLRKGTILSRQELCEKCGLTGAGLSRNIHKLINAGLLIEEPEPMFVSGSEMETLWSTASQIANDLGVDRYQVMYALYEANKDFFVNNDINAPRADRDYFVDLAIIETVDVVYASREVKRHIFCRC